MDISSSYEETINLLTSSLDVLHLDVTTHIRQNASPAHDPLQHLHTGFSQHHPPPIFFFSNTNTAKHHQAHFYTFHLQHHLHSARICSATISLASSLSTPTDSRHHTNTATHSPTNTIAKPHNLLLSSHSHPYSMPSSSAAGSQRYAQPP